MTPAALPKIELHVHLEGAIRPATLLEIANRNGLRLPFGTEAEAAQFYQFRDFTHFIEIWMLTTNVLQTAQDYQQIVHDYAAEAAAHGAVYLEGIFSPFERIVRGIDPDEIFNGYCDGAAQAQQEYAIQVRLTPDIGRQLDPAEVEPMIRDTFRYADRGVVGLGLGGNEADSPAADWARCFASARDGGLGSVPHAGESTGPAAVRDAVEVLGANRIRHGIGAATDSDLLAELAERGIGCDVCPTSNVRTGVVPSLAAHPMPRMVAAGVACTVNTDDPAMFDTDLGREYAQLDRLGTTARQAYQAGVSGALCDEPTRARLREIGAATNW
ncbi:MAG TPA: adenosine deaminase [Actinomycetes bacterium]|nr:adenosine deaminase [Actinomycetes bacterium]